MVAELSLVGKKLPCVRAGEGLNHVAWSYFWSEFERSPTIGTSGSSGLGLHGKFRWPSVVKTREKEIDQG